ncbi:MAG: PAS domain S-box protein [Deltaproteobacteria bacterium]|jgi:PAS domain S-box-containing protein|nr:PAS domain S-box protein [Deltaproteobacteria bacterium]MBT4644647.1 PAS domain S-box protein [Deltaproteobacteria bacterium]
MAEPIVYDWGQKTRFSLVDKEENMKFKTKILLSLSPLIVLVTVTIFTVNYFKVIQILENMAENQMKRTVDAVFYSTETLLQTAISNYLRGMTENHISMIRKIYEEHQNGQLTVQQAKDEIQLYSGKHQVGTSGYFAQYSLKDNKIFLAIHPFQRGVDCSTKKQCQLLSQHESGYIEYNWKNPQDNSVRKKVAYLLRFEAWNWIGGVTSYKDEFTELVKISELKKIIVPIKFQQSGYLAVFDENGKTLIHPELSGKDTQSLRDADGELILKKFKNKKNGFVKYRWRDISNNRMREKYAYIKYLKDFRFYLVATGYVDEIIKPIDNVGTVIILLSLVAILVLATVIFWFSNTITRPLNRILKGIYEFYQYRTPFIATGSGVMEIQELESSFSEMTTELNEYISQLQQKESALKSSQQKVLLHVEQTPLAVIELNLEFEVTDWNPAAEKIFGYTKKEAMGRHLIGLILSEKAGIVVDDLWDRLIKQKGGEHSTNENITKTGKTICCEWYNTPLIDEAGDVIGVASLAQDITDRIWAEKELRLTKYSVDNSSSAAFWIKQNGQFHYANKAASRLSGYSHQELLTISLADINSSSTLDALNAHRNELEEEGSRNFEIVITSKQGHQIPVEVNTNLLHFEGEKYVFATVIDITERRKSEMERTRLVSAIEQSSDNVVITDLKGNIEYANPAFERNTGFSRTEAQGKNPRILKSGKQNDDFYRNMWETITDGKIWTGNIINKRKDGKLIEEFATIFPVLASSGETRNFVAVKRDMTEQNKLENQLRQMEKLDAIGTLTSGIAHDFNNILGAIFGYTQLSKRKLLPTPENQKILGYLDKIFSAGLRAKELIDQILMFSRKGNYNPKNLNLQPLLEESIKFLRSTIPTTISINSHIDPELRNIYGDATQIQQIIMNLCTNASHAMEENGGILEVVLTNYKIEYKALDTEILDPGDYLLLTVSDTGKGMNDETKQRIFEPFFTTKEKGKGTGLGLSSVHGIVAKHGGAINVCSQEGLGTKFNIYFPALLNNAKKTEKEVEPELPTGTESILLVDDEPDLIDAYGEMFRLQGYRVQITLDSREALSRFKKNPRGYDLIVTDYTMPEMNGIELSREIHKYNNRVPVILISGLGELIPEDELKSTGIVARYSKPVEFGTLVRGVKNTLDRK